MRSEVLSRNLYTYRFSTSTVAHSVGRFCFMYQMRIPLLKKKQKKKKRDAIEGKRTIQMGIIIFWGGVDDTRK